jgi:hypothetical protein
MGGAKMCEYTDGIADGKASSAKKKGGNPCGRRP